jgi:hypothetical protein
MKLLVLEGHDSFNIYERTVIVCDDRSSHVTKKSKKLHDFREFYTKNTKKNCISNDETDIKIDVFHIH